MDFEISQILELMGLSSSEIKEWGEQELPMFGQTPNQMIQEGKRQELLSALKALASGNVSS